AFLTVIMSNIMSNTATATILIPISIILTYKNPVVLPLVIGLCASVALFLPISTPPNAIAYSTGFLEQKDFRLGGLVFGIIGPLLITAIVILIFMVLYQLP
ncbi:anion permease, partial [Eudoraea sp.]|uniref:anion permease n=1 Tax=Eudoraea sp. TaxID=1979955 RepID=UPI003C79023A